MYNKAAELYHMHTKASTHIIIIITLGFILAIIPFIQSNWLPTSPDSAGLSCAAQHLTSAGEFAQNRTRGFDFHYNPCWTQQTYPGNQVFTAGIITITGAPASSVVVWLSILTFIAIAIAIYIAVWLSTDERTLALWSGLGAITSLALARSLLLTPHNLYGYLGIILIILGIVIWERSRHWLSVVLIILSIAFLTVFHALSLAIVGISLALYTLASTYKKPKILLILFGVLLLINIGVALIMFGTINPIVPVESILAMSIPGITNPWYDHPAVWGYIATSIGALGIAYRISSKDMHPALHLGIWIGLVSIFFGHPEITQIEILPERVIAYGWIPLAIALGDGVLVSTGWLKAKWRYLLSILIIAGMALHFSIFIQDSYEGISKRFIPDTDFIESMQWLETQRTDDTFLLAVGNTINRKITYSGLWYYGDSAWYPWYRLNHKNIHAF